MKLCGILFVLAFVETAGAVVFSVTPIAAPGLALGDVTGFNNAGWVCGRVDFDGGAQNDGPIVWRAGVLTLFGSADDGSVFDVNNIGDIVLFDRVLRGQSMIMLPDGFYPKLINNSGILIGQSVHGEILRCELATGIVSPIAVPRPPGFSSNLINAINDSGNIAGYEDANISFPWSIAGTLPVVIINGQFTRLYTLGGGYGSALDIGSDDVAIGASEDMLGRTRACRWAGLEPTELGTLGGSYSVAWSVNSGGVIAGLAADSHGFPRLALWRGQQIEDAHAGLAPDFLYGVRNIRINDPGQVLVTRSNFDTALLTPHDCVGYMTGDANCDGAVNNFDIDVFVEAITDPGAWVLARPLCNFYCVVDINRDGAVNNFDIDPFVTCILAGACP